MKNLNINSNILNEKTNLLSNLFNSEQQENIMDILRKSNEVENPMDSDETTEDYFDRISDEMSDTISLWEIKKDSLLYQALIGWYRSQNKDMSKSIRGFVNGTDSIYWISGIGYDINDRDLLDGNGSGNTVEKFIAWINE